MKTIPVICYKVKNPVVYNQGTKWEKTCDTFLACYGCADVERNKAYIDLLNTDDEARANFCADHRLDPATIECFYHYEQEPFDTRGD